jgi:outer membrane protein assembly factor BamB
MKLRSNSRQRFLILLKVVAFVVLSRIFPLQPIGCAADWPRLGGPDGTGVSSETGLARTWPTNGPRELWAIDLAEGFAGPAVYQGQVFVLDRVPDKQDLLRCWQLDTGREIWSARYDAPGTLPFNGSRNVPTVDDHYVFALGPFGQLHCFNRETHAELWARHLVEDFKDPNIGRPLPASTREEELARAQVPMWGMTQAPLLYRDVVIVAPQTQSTGLVAYEKATGKVRWKSGYIGRNWYSHVSPYLTKLCGIEQVIMLAQPSDPEKPPDDAPPALISSIDPLTGQILWMTNTVAPDKIPIPEPVRVAENRLLISGGYKFGCLLLEVSCAAGRWETKPVLGNRTVCPHIHSPVLYQNWIYLTSFRAQGAKHTGLVCLNTHLQPLWETGPALEFDSGSFLIADGMMFIMHGKTGRLNLLDLLPAGPKVLAQAKVLNAVGGNLWAPMALSDGKLLVRDQHQMKCLDVR